MDSDLSLIEISGEDDSLLQPIPDRGARNINSSDYFLCSPLQIPRSKSKPIEAISANRVSFSVDCANKENFNVEKSEDLKLSVEPQQMKRKKKAGGFNLRKSLAWDRAFFTEEGVLDDSELSMISGSSSKFSGKTLSVIQEEDVGNSYGLKTIDENLLKESPATKKVGANLLSKEINKAALNSVTSRKVLTTFDVNRSGTKRSACPRPVASSSLKRPASTIPTKSLLKDTKVSKLPVQKPNPSGPSRIGKSYIPSPRESNRSQTTKPVLASKPVSTKTSLGQAKRLVSSVKCHPANKQLRPKTEANKYSCSNGNATILSDGGLVKVATPSLQNNETQTKKPSGLRMPSPSLGFFTQSTALAQSPLKETTQPCVAPESHMPNLRKLGLQTSVSAKKPPLAPRGLHKVTIDGKTAENIKASSLSVPTYISDLNDNMESCPQVNNFRLMVDNVSSDNTYEAIKDRSNLRGIFDGVDQLSLGRVGQCSGKAISELENTTFQRVEESFSQKSLQQLDKNVVDVKVVEGCLIGTEIPETENLHCSDHSEYLIEEIDPSAQSDTTDVMVAEGQPCYPSLMDHSVSSQLTSGKSIIEQLSEEQAEVKLAKGNQCCSSPMDHIFSSELTSGKLIVEQLSVEQSEVKLAEGKPSSSLMDHIASSELTSGKLIVKQLSEEQSEVKIAEGKPCSPHMDHIASSELSLEKLIVEQLSEEQAEVKLAEGKPCSFPMDHIASSEPTSGKFPIEQLQQAEVVHHLSCEAGLTSGGCQMLQENVADVSPCQKLTEKGKEDAIITAKLTRQSNMEELGALSTDVNTIERTSADHFKLTTNVSDVTEKPEVLELDELLSGTLHVDECFMSEESFPPEEAKQENVLLCGEPEVEDTHGSDLNWSSNPCLLPVTQQLDCGSYVAKLVEAQNSEESNCPSAIIDIELVAENEYSNTQAQDDVGVHDETTPMELGIMEVHSSAEDVNTSGQNSEQEVIFEDDALTENVDQANIEDRNLTPSAEIPRCNSNSQPEQEGSPIEQTSIMEDQNTGADKKKESLVVKPPANLVPFSDEWLAALEAAGEEILTMKSGAVQNSPEERSEPKPGPWSPVKRKPHQTIGPFDCTKHTNH